MRRAGIVSILMTAAATISGLLSTSPLVSFAKVSGSAAGLDPATWTAGRLAAQLTFACVLSDDTAQQRRLATKRIGGITLLGRSAPEDLRKRLASVAAAAPYGVRPVVASDEEGGEVQRLANVIYPLPSAEAMGRWSSLRVRTRAKDYGRRMRALGVTMALAPVADLALPGGYIADTHRSFGSSPEHVRDDVLAFATGLREAGVMPVVKHWPGQGQAGNTHTGIGQVPPLSTLERRDLIPFTAAFRAGMPIVMVAHVQSRGLTEPGVPASESPRALRYLRAHGARDALVITDELSMAAASAARGISVPEAAVRALSAGADVALSRKPASVVAAIKGALRSGRLPSAQAVASARVLLGVKARAGLLDAYTGPVHSSISLRPGVTTVPQGATVPVGGTVTGGYRPILLQHRTSSGWSTIGGATSDRDGEFALTATLSGKGVVWLRVIAQSAFPYGPTASRSLAVRVA